MLDHDIDFSHRPNFVIIQLEERRQLNQRGKQNKNVNIEWNKLQADGICGNMGKEGDR